jgi:hypothetical protein
MGALGKQAFQQEELKICARCLFWAEQAQEFSMGENPTIFDLKENPSQMGTLFHSHLQD